MQRYKKIFFFVVLAPFFHDSKDFFSGYDKRTHDLRGLSPLEIVSAIGLYWHVRINPCKVRPDQAIEIAGGEKERNWCLSFIRESVWICHRILGEDRQVIRKKKNTPNVR